MFKSRATYLFLIFLTVALGLLSRKINSIPLATGDSLYAVMLYWGCRFFLVNKPFRYSFWLAILFCFCIEFLQLIHHPLLNSWRNHSYLRLILGQGFLWTDLIAYSTGASIAYLTDKKFCHYNAKHH